MFNLYNSLQKNKKLFLFCIFIGFLGLLFFISLFFPPAKKHFSGYTDTFYVYLSSPSMGFVEQKKIQRGTPFKKGQVLLSLSQEPDASQLQAANAMLAQADKILLDLKRPRRRPEREAIKNQILQVQASIDKITLFYNRIVKLSAKQFVAQDTIDTNRKMIEELKFQKKALEENLKLSKMGARAAQISAQTQAIKGLRAKIFEVSWYLEHKKMIAPADGYVFDIFYNIGDFVPAQKPILALVLPDNNYIEFFVSAHDMKSLHLNQMLHFHYFDDDQMHAAKIFYISQTVEYMPPILFTHSYQEELVFRVRARPLQTNKFLLGQPIEVFL